VAFGVSSAAVWALGPVVKAAGFDTLLLLMAGISLVTLLAVSLLPPTAPRAARTGVIETAAPTRSSRAAN
jgi:hypothetical protein